jgi:recombination protein RecA
MYNEGISKAGDLIDLGVDHGVIKKSGAWFTYGEDRFQGREGFKNSINEDKDLLSRIELEVKKKLKMVPEESEEVKEVKEVTKNKK